MLKNQAAERAFKTSGLSKNRAAHALARRDTSPQERSLCDSSQARRPDPTAAGAWTDHGVVSLGRLSIRAVLWDFGRVNRQITIRRLLAIVMIAGLVLAPLSSPVMAGATSDASMSAMADDMSMSAIAGEMAGDMPCCPSKAPAPVDCDKCVFMTACMSKCFTGMSATVFHPFFSASDSIADLQNESWLDGLGHPPPEHPPRTLT